MKYHIDSLGEPKITSPLIEKYLDKETAFVDDDSWVVHNPIFRENADPDAELLFQLAGPRKKIYFNPDKVKSAIVTCGGLCPGLNDVIRSIVMQSHYRYGAKDIIGIRYGYNGLNPNKGYDPFPLNPQLVRDIHRDGGTILGSSRGGTEDMELLMDTLEKMDVNILYTIGGDGTQRGAHDIATRAKKRGMELSVIAIPKTIDNDISYIERSFGFETAFSIAVQAISAAHTEAEGAPMGIGLVKLMGRHSGFIAANAALAMNDVNFVLIPEMPLDLERFFYYLDERMKTRDHAVICVAEGVGQDLLCEEGEKVGHDKSHNIKLKDIGLFLKNKISEFYNKKGVDINLKYIDPSYMIRSAPAVPNDSIFTALLGQYAVHAGMAGKTDMIVGFSNDNFNHVPIELAISRRKLIDINSLFWHSVIEATGQPVSWKSEITR